MPKLEISIIILIGFIMGFSFNEIFEGFSETETNGTTIQIPIQKIETEKCQQYVGLTSEDIKLLIRQQFIPALEFNYAIDDSMGKPRLVPLIKEICNCNKK